MNTPQHIDTLFLFEKGSKNIIVNDNHGEIYANGTERQLKTKRVAKDATPEKADDDVTGDRLSSLLAYLQPLGKHYNPQLTLPAADALTQLLSDPDIAAWIFTGKAQEGGFSKTKAFKLARMLRVQHFYLDKFVDKELDQLLEQSTVDTNYRKNMNKEYRNDQVIEAHIKRFVEPLLKKS